MNLEKKEILVQLAELRIELENRNKQIECLKSLNEQLLFYRNEEDHKQLNKMYTAKFLYDIYEEKYAIIPGFSWGSGGKDYNWHLATEHCSVAYPSGYKMNSIMRYVRVKEEDVLFHSENIKVAFQIGDRVKLKNEIAKIVDVVKNLDGSINYHTDKKEFISLNTYDTYFDERNKTLTKDY